MSEVVDYEKLLYARSASTLKVHGILSIVFGGLGTLAAIVFMGILALGNFSDSAYTADGSALGVFFVGIIVFIFWTLPHIYLIVSGTYLIREPAPKIVKTLVIINLVIGVFWNLVLLIFAIINLTEVGDYERGYHVHRKTNR
ncbi:MAG: hypothetical protein JWO99_220 [Candidatus Saccharibacteria bacterium]|nr:hypothetical protein [Candidatus Saccharibacteria bacterium]